MLFVLDKNKLVFPSPELADEDGLLAIGGDLGAERLLLAYNNGIFPWYSDDEPISWFSPHRRCVLFPHKVIVGRTMNKIITEAFFEIKTNTAFAEVINNCKEIKRKNESGTWITDEMLKAYIQLHALGKAHSVEVWRAGKLVGGLYGVVVNKVFCGESMFSKESNASKAALIWLCRNGNYQLIDCQVPNAYLLSMGAEIIDRQLYMDILSRH